MVSIYIRHKVEDTPRVLLGKYRIENGPSNRVWKDSPREERPLRGMIMTSADTNAMAMVMTMVMIVIVAVGVRVRMRVRVRVDLRVEMLVVIMVMFVVVAVIVVVVVAMAVVVAMIVCGFVNAFWCIAVPSSLRPTLHASYQRLLL